MSDRKVKNHGDGGRRLRSVTWAGCVLIIPWIMLALPAFGSDAADAGPSWFNLAPDEEEVAALEKRVLDRIATYKAQSCVRPVLRGEPVVGSAAEMIAEILEGRGQHERCLELTHSNPGILTFGFRRSILPDTLIAFLEKPVGGFTDEDLGAIRTVCGILPDAVRAAVAHQDACGSWHPGTGVRPPEIEVRRCSLVSVILGRLAYRPEDALHSAQAALDLIRFNQDLIRGGGTLMLTMLTVRSVVWHQGPWLRWLLDRGAIGQDGLASLVDEIGILIDTEPPIGEIVEAIGEWQFLLMPTSIREHQDWSPPLGRGHRFDQATSNNFLARSRELFDERTSAGLLLVGLERFRQELTAACPPTARPLDCIRGIRRLEEARALRRQASVLTRTLEVILAPNSRRELRNWMVDTLLGYPIYGRDRLLELYVARSIQLAAYRIHAAVLAAWAGAGTCPEDFSDDSWAGIIKDPIFEGDFSISRNPSNHDFVVRSAGTFRHESTNEDLVYRFRCPPGR